MKLRSNDFRRVSKIESMKDKDRNWNGKKGGWKEKREII